MDTTLTMACVAETLGISLPGSAAIPAMHTDRLVTPESVDNALRALLVLGGSSNAVIHLAAITGRTGRPAPAGTSERAAGNRPGAGQPQADWRALHGGLLQHQRHGSRVARTAVAAASGLPDGHGRDARPTPEPESRRHHRPRRDRVARGRSSSRATWSPCSGRSRRAARCSSDRPPTRAQAVAGPGNRGGAPLDRPRTRVCYT